jgi:hypothetical protein
VNAQSAPLSTLWPSDVMPPLASGPQLAGVAMPEATLVLPATIELRTTSVPSPTPSPPPPARMGWSNPSVATLPAMVEFVTTSVLLTLFQLKMPPTSAAVLPVTVESLTTRCPGRSGVVMVAGVPRFWMPPESAPP